MIERAFWNDNFSIDRLAAVLRDDGIAIGSSDTVFGLIANLKCSGKEALDRVKKRIDKPYLILISTESDLGKFVDPRKLLQIEKLASKCWPGPVTLICPARSDLPDFMKGPDGTIALRMPAHEGLRQLLKSFDGLFSTSANISGCPVPESIDTVDPEVLAQCSILVLDSPDVVEAKGLPSTILDCTGEEIKLVRQGVFPVEKLLGKMG